jgi:hypothetical protein
MRGLCNAVARGKKIEIRKWRMEAKRGTMYRAPTSGKADPAAPGGMTIGKREKRGRTEVRPYT